MLLLLVYRCVLCDVHSGGTGSSISLVAYNDKHFVVFDSHVDQVG